MNNLSSPSAQGSGSAGGKGKRPQNIVPVMIKEVLEAPEEGFTIEGMEVGEVVVLGQIREVEKTATKTTYKIEDSTGSLDVIQWTSDGPVEAEHFEGSYIKAVGSMRTQGEKKHLMAFQVLDCPSQEERDFHLLQVVHSHLKLKQLHAKMTGQEEMDQSGLSNSMMGGGIGSSFGGTMSMGTSSSASFGNKTYDTVYSLIKQSTESEGINVNSIYAVVQGKMSRGEMDGAIEYLSNEGHIYSTVDDDHFKTTDG